MISSPSPSNAPSGPAFSTPKATANTPRFGQILGNEIVEMYAGQDKILYRVHKAVLCNSIEYFRKMFTNGFKKNREQTVNFPELECPVFDLFLEWIYRGSIQSPPRSAVHDLARRLHTLNLVRLYAFAEQICSGNLNDYVMTLLISKWIKQKVRLSIIGTSRIYEFTAAGSPLRAYAAQNLHYRMLKAGDEGTYATERIIAGYEKERRSGDRFDGTYAQ